MRSISLWARQHRSAAIILLITGKLLLVFLAYYLGRSLRELAVTLPGSFYIAGLAAVSLAAIFYPKRRKNRSKKYFYFRQKTCDWLIAAGSFVVTVTLFNTAFAVARPLFSSAAVVVGDKPTAEEILASLKYRDKSTLTPKEKRILRQEFKKQTGIYVKAKIGGDEDKANQSLLIILTIILAIGLWSLLAAIACSLSCNGAEAAAAILLIFGTIAIILGVVAVIRSIKGRRRRRMEFIANPD